MTTRAALIGLVRAYRYAISPWLPRACRFEPTCSQYAIDALELHGALRGSGLALRRLSRCHPFHRGGFDPVPPLREAGPRIDGGASLPRPER